MNNYINTFKRVVGSTLALGIIAASGGTWAQQKEVTIAYQAINGPFISVIDSGDIEKATGYKINWRNNPNVK